MSDGERRLRVIAIGFAAVAMVVAIAAALVVTSRRDDAPAPAEPEKPALAPLIDKTVLATDVIKLQRKAIEPVVENGQTLGVKIKDPDLARMLGLEPQDIIVSLSGRPLSRETDVYDVIFNVSMMSGTTMYVEIMREGAPTLVRWKLDGDLRQARYANSGNTLGGLYGSGAYTPPPLPPPDPMLDAIEKVDGTHVKMPRATAEYVFGNPVATMKGMHVFQARKNGQPAGLKVLSVRPSSVFAKIGLQTGDTIEDINGIEVTTPDKALEIFMKLQKVSDVAISVTRRDGNPVQLHIAITK
jgi:type II secretory pathway component PulC